MRWHAAAYGLIAHQLLNRSQFWPGLRLLYSVYDCTRVTQDLADLSHVFLVVARVQVIAAVSDTHAHWTADHVIIGAALPSDAG